MGVDWQQVQSHLLLFLVTNQTPIHLHDSAKAEAATLTCTNFAGYPLSMELPHVLSPFHLRGEGLAD